jgi:hypothetical protein
MPYAPKAGDLIRTDFDPRIGREQSGRRPASCCRSGCRFPGKSLPAIGRATLRVPAYRPAPIADQFSGAIVDHLVVFSIAAARQSEF